MTEETPTTETTEAPKASTADLVKTFAFVSPTQIPKRATDDRLGDFRAKQAIERRAAGEAAAKGLLAGKALTDNAVYENQIGAVRVSSRAKTLVAPILAEHNQRASVTTSGSDAEGWRWHIVAKPVEDDE